MDAKRLKCEPNPAIFGIKTTQYIPYEDIRRIWLEAEGSWRRLSMPGCSITPMPNRPRGGQTGRAWMVGRCWRALAAQTQAPALGPDWWPATPIRLPAAVGKTGPPRWTVISRRPAGVLELARAERSGNTAPMGTELLLAGAKRVPQIG